nr:MAG TPA: hypothetical protein [Caudoviricetes sp.]
MHGWYIFRLLITRRQPTAARCAALRSAGI